ncbi:MAG: hypothetical protein ACR2QG_01505 [Gammaproteobacteria bacterium]
MSVLVLATACSSTDYYGEWNEPRPLLLPFSKMLIVVDSPYKNFREELEQQLYEGVTRSGTLGTTATLLDSNGNVEEEALVMMLERSFADSLLLIQIRHQAENTEQPGTIDIAPADAEPKPDILPELAGQTVILDATVYDISSNGRAVYTIDLETRFKDKGVETVYYAADNISGVILGELRGAKIIDD